MGEQHISENRNGLGLLALSFILAGILARFAMNTQGFTDTIAAVAVFSGAYLSRKKAVLFPLLVLVVCDLMISGGPNKLLLFNWLAFVVIVMIAGRMHKKSLAEVSVFTVLSACLYVAVVTFGNWMMGFYPMTLQALLNVYLMKFQFLWRFILSTIVYSAVFFGLYEFLSSKVKNPLLRKFLF